MENRIVGELTEMARDAKDALQRLASSGKELARSGQEIAAALNRLAVAGERIAEAINNHKNGFSRGQLAVLVPLVVGVIVTALGTLLKALG